MAEEFIRSVLDTEEECRKKEANAKSLADTKKQNAKIEAERSILEAKKSVDEMLQQDADAIAKSSDKQLQREKDALRLKCEELSKTADKNRSRVTKLAAQLLVAE